MLSPLRLKDKLFYGWWVVVVFVTVGTTIYGVRFSFGVFFKSIESEFNLTRTGTSMVYSVYMVLGCVFTVLGGWALDRYGPRLLILIMGFLTGLSLLLTSQTNSLWQLFITYSLLLAMGGNALYAVTMSTVSRWFDKKRGLALGIAASGAGLGQMVMAPFATYLIANFNWRMANIVIGLIAWLVVIPLSRLLKRDPYEIGALPDGVKSYSKEDVGITKSKSGEDSIQPADLSLRQIFRVRSFWLLMFVFLFYAFCLFLVLTHLVPHVTDIGISATRAAALLSLIGGASIVSRVLMGITSDRIGRKVAFIICSLLQSGAMAWLIWAQDLWMFYLFAVVYGFGYGGMAPLMAVLVGDAFGLGRIGVIIGILDVGFGIGAAIGPVIGGLIFDATNSYSLAFLLGAVAMLIVTFITPPLRRETARNYS